MSRRAGLLDRRPPVDVHRQTVKQRSVERGGNGPAWRTQPTAIAGLATIFEGPRFPSETTRSEHPSNPANSTAPTDPTQTAHRFPDADRTTKQPHRPTHHRTRSVRRMLRGWAFGVATSLFPNDYGPCKRLPHGAFGDDSRLCSGDRPGASLLSLASPLVEADRLPWRPLGRDDVAPACLAAASRPPRSVGGDAFRPSRGAIASGGIGGGGGNPGGSRRARGVP